MNPDQTAPWVILVKNFAFKTIGVFVKQLFIFQQLLCKTNGQFPVFSLSNYCNGQFPVTSL